MDRQVFGTGDRDTRAAIRRSARHRIDSARCSECGLELRLMLTAGEVRIGTLLLWTCLGLLVAASTPFMLFVAVVVFGGFTPIMLLLVTQTVVAGVAAAIAIARRRRFMPRSVG